MKKFFILIILNIVEIFSKLLGMENGSIFFEVIIVLFEFDDKYNVLRVRLNIKFEDELMGVWVLL